MNHPKVSIVTPSYNQAQFIEETILSVQNQDYSNIEHIIIDGNSTDGTVNILKKYGDKITWISEEDKGQSEAINKGFELSTGEIIGWLNSDDVYFYQDVVSKIVNFFSQHRDIDITYGDNAFIGPDSSILQIRSGIKRFNRELLLRNNFINQPTVFFRRHILESFKLDIQLRFAMDYDFWLKVSEKYKFSYCDFIVAGARYHSQCKGIAGKGGRSKEDMIIWGKYMSRSSWRFHINRLIGRILNRYQILRGLPKIISLSTDDRFAFDIRLGSKVLRFCRQIFGLISSRRFNQLLVQKDNRK